MTAAIRVESLSKRYRIGQRALAKRCLREVLVDAAAAPVRRLRQLGQAAARPEETLWALRDVSFEVRPGEVIGIVGRNGAGKSTLLKILSQITEPTDGRVTLRGRVASLLEVGTGFHQELTGRENIFLNAAILGMHRSEVLRKFDEIVAFAEIDRFLDTPVKRYSSGMYVRLAFAVAAHLEPEILLVDEVLAVGDAEFQRKCLGRMTEVASGGRTVLFVSHNMVAVESLCPRAILLEGGRLVDDGESRRVIERYFETFRSRQEGIALDARADRDGNGVARYTGIRFFRGDGQPTTSVPMGEELVVELDFACREALTRPRFVLLFLNAFGQIAFRAKSHAAIEVLPTARNGGTVRCRFPAVNAVPGLYTVTARINDSVAERVDGVESAATLEVTEADVYGTGRMPQEHGDLMYMPADWSVDYR